MKKLLSLLLIIVMVLGLCPAYAMASGADTVYLSVSYEGQYGMDKNGAAMAYVPVPLSALSAIDLAEYGLEDFVYDADGDGSYDITALHLYIYAHETLMGLNWSDVTVSGYPGAIYFENGLFGYTCNLQYYLNGTYPEVDGWGLTVDQIAVNAGDFLDVAAFNSWAFFMDSGFGFHSFLDNGSITHAYAATAGEAVTVTLGRGASVMGGSYSMAEVADYTVSYGTAMGTALGTVTTDASGQATVTFPTAGTYYLWADGTYGVENPMDIVSAPGCAVVTVTARECSHSWTDATCTTPKTCSLCGDTEGAADPNAHSYDNGTCIYCSAAQVVPVTGVLLDKTEISLEEGASAQLSATVTPENATDATVTWSTSDAAVVTVEAGTVQAFGAGTATVKAAAGGMEAACAVTVTAKPVSPDWRTVMPKTQTHLKTQAEATAPVVSSTGGEWQVLGLVRSGIAADSAFFATYCETAAQYVTENIDAETNRLHNNKSTDNSRLILALRALGKDVTNFAGCDLTAGLTDTDYVKRQGINGPIWALIALDCGDYEIPANADSTKQVTRDWLISYILENQLTDGGWALSGTTPDDMTPMAVQALAPYYEANADVKAAVDKAIPIMEAQLTGGNAELYAQIIVARSALGLDCTDAMTKMMEYALEDGTFRKGLTGASNQMSTEQAFYAMVACDRRLSGKTALYDMSDVTVETVTPDPTPTPTPTPDPTPTPTPTPEFGLMPEEIAGYATVSFEDRGIRRSGELGSMDAKFSAPLGTIVPATSVPFKAGDTVASVTLRLLQEKGITARYEGSATGGFYLEAIGNFTAGGKQYTSFGELDAGVDSGWMITQNGWFIDQGASQFAVQNGDTICWKYTCQRGADIGDTGALGGTAGTTTETEQKTETVGLEGKHEDVQKTAIVTEDVAFTDTVEHENAAAIEALTARGIIDGFPDGTFGPEKTMTRAQFAAIVIRALGLPQKTTGKFADVAEGAWYAAYVDSANAYGIVNGRSEDTFDPEGTITRQEASAMVARAAKLCGMDTTLTETEVRDMLAQFGDYVTIDSWAKESMAFCYGEEILNRSDLDTQPNRAILRCEIAQMLYNMLGSAKLL